MSWFCVLLDDLVNRCPLQIGLKARAEAHGQRVGQAISNAVATYAS